MTNIAANLESIELMDADENLVTIGSAWSEGPALVVFIRHFG